MVRCFLTRQKYLRLALSSLDRDFPAAVGRTQFLDGATPSDDRFDQVDAPIGGGTLENGEHTSPLAWRQEVERSVRAHHRLQRRVGSPLPEIGGDGMDAFC